MRSSRFTSGSATNWPGRGLGHRLQRITQKALTSRLKEFRSRYETAIGRSERQRQVRIESIETWRDALLEKAKRLHEARC